MPGLFGRIFELRGNLKVLSIYSKTIDEDRDEDLFDVASDLLVPRYERKGLQNFSRDLLLQPGTVHG